MTRNNLLVGLLSLILSVSMSSCATTALTFVWKDSAYQGGPLKKILIIGVFRELDMKKYFEDEFARELKASGVDAVASYTVFPEEDVLNKEIIVEKIRELKMDSVLVTSVIDVRDDSGYETYPTHVNPGGNFYDYYVMCCQTTVTSGSVVMLETRIFEEKYDKLLWSATSESSLQRYREDTIQSFISAAIRDLHNKNLVH
jgi:hypothetical protein